MCAEPSSEPGDLNSRALRDRAVAAARGDAAFDLLITDADIFDATTGEIRPADIGIVGPLIASVHSTGSREDAEKILNAAGAIVSPGLIDSHMHIESSMVTPSTYAQAVVPRGVTSVVWDPHELGNVHGLAGVDWAIAATANLPLRVIILAPSCVPAAPAFERSGADFGASEMHTLLSNPAIGGVAEVMNMRGVIEREPRMSDVVQAGLSSGKPLCGHARGLSGPQLAAFMAAGISSDHELTSANDLLEKLRAGLTIELRGSHDHLLPEFVTALNSLGHLPASVTLCTDDVFPDDLLIQGGLDSVVRRLIAYGMPPSWALRASTLNAAMRLGRPDLGLVAVGRRADLCVFDNLQELRALHVITNGRRVASDGRLTSPAESVPTDLLLNSVKCTPLQADDFQLRADAQRVLVSTIDQPRFTRHGQIEAEVENGFVKKPDSITLIAVTHRHGFAKPVPRIGYLAGWGNWQGAFCTTVSHDSHNLTAFGASEVDLALACNAVMEMQGGMAVVANGEVVATLALPLSGLLSDAPLTQIGAQFKTIRDAMDEIVDWQPPLLVFKACFGATLACNSGPHQTDMGMADVSASGPVVNPVLKILA